MFFSVLLPTPPTHFAVLIIITIIQTFGSYTHRCRGAEAKPRRMFSHTETPTYTLGHFSTHEFIILRPLRPQLCCCYCCSLLLYIHHPSSSSAFRETGSAPEKEIQRTEKEPQPPR
jgi:hypothetical protein